MTPEQLIDAVETAGYTAQLPATGPVETRAEDDPTAALRTRLIVSAVLTVPVVAMAMIPALQFTNWQWLSLTLAAPVVVWGCAAVPPGRLDESASRQRHHGHAHFRWAPSRRSAGRCMPCSGGPPGCPG